MDYIELKVKLPSPDEQRDIVISELADLGFESFVEEEEGLTAYIKASDYTPGLIDTSAYIFENKLNFQITETLIRERNWNAEWESSFQPVNIEDRCVIRASFHEKPEDVGYDIIIDPNMSFGTGHHETTWLMVKEMLDMDLRQKQVLDMGCGTAVLAILAAKMGASEILAVDVEKKAVENSMDNIRLNNVQNKRITVQKGDSGLLAEKQFHIILANINKNVLLGDIPRYSHNLAGGGELLMSGFFETDAASITEKAATAGLTLTRKNLKNQWCLLHFVKESPLTSS